MSKELSFNEDVKISVKVLDGNNIELTIDKRETKNCVVRSYVIETDYEKFAEISKYVESLKTNYVGFRRLLEGMNKARANYQLVEMEDLHETPCDFNYRNDLITISPQGDKTLKITPISTITFDGKKFQVGGRMFRFDKKKEEEFKL